LIGKIKFRLFGSIVSSYNKKEARVLLLLKELINSCIIISVFLIAAAYSEEMEPV